MIVVTVQTHGDTRYRVAKWTVERGQWARFLRSLRRDGKAPVARLMNRSVNEAGAFLARRILYGVDR